MKLVSGNRITFDYDPHTSRLHQGQNLWCKPFVFDKAIESVMGLVYAHNSEHKNMRPRHVVITLGGAQGATANDPNVLLHLLRKNLHVVHSAKYITFLGADTLFSWDVLCALVTAFKQQRLINNSCKFYVCTNGLLIDQQKVNFLTEHDFLVVLKHNGPGHTGDDSLTDGSDSHRAISQIAQENLLIQTAITRTSFDRAEIINHFFALLDNNHNPAIASFELFKLTAENQNECLYLENPQMAMEVLYNQYKIGLAERFYDFWPIVQAIKYRISMQNYSILESFNRAADQCLNVDTIYIDLDGNVYTDPSFQNTNSIMGNIGDMLNLSVCRSKFFVENMQLRNQCRGCPVLPMCLGGDLHISENMQELDCLQRFVYWAPLWTYIMNGYILETPITTIRDASFVHKDLYLDFINSDIYQSAVRR